MLFQNIFELHVACVILVLMFPTFQSVENKTLVATALAAIGLSKGLSVLTGVR